jgi:class 3 adenylate cyclase/pimeloyl-ACP methyl ester carboxylesterase
VDVPETRYAETVDGVSIAYQVAGSGSPVILVAMSAWASNVDIVWEWEPIQALYRGLADAGTLVFFDRRGTGLSDRVSGDRLPSLDARMDDIRAVMDAVGAERAILYGMEDGGAQCMLFAATYPERTRALILCSAASRGLWSPETPWLWTAEQWDEDIRRIEREWGTQPFAEAMTREVFPSHVGDPEFLRQYARVIRHSMGRADAVAATRMWRDTDVRHVLPLIQAPTLVMHYTGDLSESVEEGRSIAAHIPGARFAELPGADHSAGDLPTVLRFLASLQSEEAEFERVLATVLFTDIVDSTAQAVRLGDRPWRDLLQRHHATVRALLGRYRGTEMDTAGDGFFATFDGPARAVRCAQAMVHAVRPLGLEIRAGLHTGEVEFVDGKASGIAVNVGARVCGAAGPSEVVVSRTVTDLVAGSGLSFDPMGERELKGLERRWELFRAVNGV